MADKAFTPQEVGVHLTHAQVEALHTARWQELAGIYFPSHFQTATETGGEGFRAQTARALAARGYLERVWVDSGEAYIPTQTGRQMADLTGCPMPTRSEARGMWLGHTQEVFAQVPSTSQGS